MAKVVVVVSPVDDQLMVSVHVYSPNIVYKMILDNENFDKINRLMRDKMHTVHFHVRMDRYRAETTQNGNKNEGKKNMTTH